MSESNPSQVDMRGVPVADWVFGYQKSWLLPDVVAGLTTAAVVIPKAMAFATIAGLPVQVGLYTAFLPMVIYAVLGSSRPLSVSTTTTLAILAAADFGQIATSNAASLLTASVTLTLLVGAILVLASILRLGFVANFIFEPVLVGFKAGVGLVMVVDQVPKILGIHLSRRPFWQQLFAIAHGLPQTSPMTWRWVTMIALLVGIEWLSPRRRAAYRGGCGYRRRKFSRLAGVWSRAGGQGPSGSSSITMPDFSLVGALWPGALGIA